MGIGSSGVIDSVQPVPVQLYKFLDWGYPDSVDRRQVC
jgi:hypothetical protein